MSRIVIIGDHEVSGVYSGLYYWVVDGTFAVYDLESLAYICKVSLDYVKSLYEDGEL